MNYTPEQLREKATQLECHGAYFYLGQYLRFGADKIEECAKLRTLIKSCGIGFGDEQIDEAIKGIK